MILEALYFLVLIPAIALLAGWATIVSAQRSADRVRAAEAEERQAARSRAA